MLMRRIRHHMRMRMLAGVIVRMIMNRSVRVNVQVRVLRPPEPRLPRPPRHVREPEPQQQPARKISPRRLERRHRRQRPAQSDAGRTKQHRAEHVPHAARRCDQQRPPDRPPPHARHGDERHVVVGPGDRVHEADRRRRGRQNQDRAISHRGAPSTRPRPRTAARGDARPPQEKPASGVPRRVGHDRPQSPEFVGLLSVKAS